MSRPRLLVLRGLGGPRPEFFAPRLAGLAEVVTLCSHLPRDSPRFAAELPVLERYGRVIAVDRPEDAVEAALRYAKSEPLSGVVTFSEYALAAAAEIAADLRLRHHPVASVRRMQDKHEQRQAMARHGLPIPKFAGVGSSDDLEGAIRVVGLPAVLKPVRGGASAATFSIDDARHASSTYAMARAAYDSHAFGAGDVPRFLLEGFIQGQPREEPRLADYVSVESLVCDGVAFHLAVTDKAPMATPFRETAHYMPSSLPSAAHDEVLAMTTRALAAVGAQSGATHTELKLTADGPRVLEVNGRVGGPMPYLFAAASNFDYVAEAARVALRLPITTTVKFRQHATYITLQAPARRVRVRSVEGIDQVRALPGVQEALISHGVGSVPNWAAAAGTLAGVLATAPTMDGLLALDETIRSTLTFAFEELPAEAVSR